MNEENTKQPTKKKSTSFFLDLKSLVIAILLAVVFRTIFFEPFHIPSGSMKSNLEIGDYLFVSKYSYGYSRYSIPFGLPFFEGRLLDGEGDDPKRGDVVVFKLPQNTSENYVKRLIGLPGDTIQMKDGVLHLNDQAIPKMYKDVYVDEKNNEIKRYTETLPSGVSYEVLDIVNGSQKDNTDVFYVPEGHYFFLGDNRDDSTDSRFLDEVGYVPYDHLVGRASIIIWPNGLKNFFDFYESVH